MEEDIIYDIEGSDPHGPQPVGEEAPVAPEEAENPAVPESPEPCGPSEEPDRSESPDSAEVPGSGGNSAEAELQRMVGEMGAETLLEIIRDNRNAAIRQIISEVEASRRHDVPSGVSSSNACRSIFDLAALA
ncbi:MAG: hypothetical protein K2N48_12510 [Muribaculaceae bacterium]|nr:hypothetical protein [Muribaculaceae bacterium]